MSHGPHLLTEDQIDAIAAEARTKPVSEIGRHVIPLVQHIIGMDMRCCRDCFFWAPYNGARQFADFGVCNHPAIDVLLAPPPEDRPPVLTPDIWYCRGWMEVKT